MSNVPFPVVHGPRPSTSTISSAAGSNAAPAFCDALRYAYDGAFRARGSLSLAQRAAYGLESAMRIERSRTEPAPVAPGARFRTVEAFAAIPFAFRVRRSAVELERADEPTHAGAILTAADGAQKPASAARPLLQVRRATNRSDFPSYRRFTARLGQTKLDCIVLCGRAFAGLRSWTR